MKPHVRRIDANPDDDYALEMAAFTVPAYCCREWQVNPLVPWGRCGLCGEKPTTNPGSRVKPTCNRKDDPNG